MKKLEQSSVNAVKPKQSVYPITQNADDPVNQSKLTASTRSRQIARENLCKRVTISSGLICDWLRK